MIESHGGSYFGSLHEKVTTHLIVGVKGGEKYHFAKNRNIHIVSRDWLIDSISKGYPLLESYYTMIDESEKRVLSNDNVKNNPAKRIIQQSSSNVMPTTTVIKKVSEPKQVESRESSKANLDIVQHIDKLIQEMNNRRKLFDGLSFYFCGLPENIYQPAKKLISQVGGTVYRDLVSAVTHIILGLNTSKKDAFMINKHEEKYQTLNKVSIEWVIECVEKSKFLSEYYDSSLIPLLEAKSTQDLSPTLQKTIYRERSIQKVEELGKKLRKISEKGTCNNNEKVEPKGFKLGASHSPPFKMKIVPNEENDILPSIPITWLEETKK
jgi:topbp1, putative